MGTADTFIPPDARPPVVQDLARQAWAVAAELSRRVVASRTPSKSQHEGEQS